MTNPSGPFDVGDLADRATAAAQRWYPGARIAGIVPLQGGRSSLTYAATATGASGGVRLVLKVAPPGLAPVRNRDVLRQARILRALQHADGVNVPEVLFLDGGEPPAVPPLFAMSFAEGRSFEPHVDAVDDAGYEDVPAADISGRARHAATMLGSLHSQDAVALGLADEPIATGRSEIDRWANAFASVGDFVDGRAAEAIDGLRAHVPADISPRIVHGDYRLGNMLSVGATVKAIIDWEIWSLGDPRIDVSWYMLCAEPAGHPMAIRVHPGMPAVDILLADYESAGGRALPDLRWFRALTLTKMAATTALIAKHNRRAGMDLLADRTKATIPVMLDGALASLC